MKQFDFGGWATKHGLLCSDGRTITENAFKHQDGAKVPLVWNHQHKDPNDVLGHAILHNKKNGVYAHCYLNDTESGRTAKELVGNGDISALSIYANKLKQSGGHVLHGQINEVSLVFTGANPGAYIDTILTHSDGSECTDEAIIYTGTPLYLMHSDEGEEQMSEQSKKGRTVAEVYETLNKEQKIAVDYIVATAADEDLEHSDEEFDSEEYLYHKEKMVGDVIDTLNEEQEAMLQLLTAAAIEAAEEEDDEDDDDEDMQHSGQERTIGDIINAMSEEQQEAVYALVGSVIEENEKEGEENMGMKHNVFEGQDDGYMRDDVLSHADGEAIVALAKNRSVGTLQNAMQSYMEENMMHSDMEGDVLQHGFTDADLEYLFPDHALLQPGEPETLMEDAAWVNRVMSRVHKSPMSRIKTRQIDARKLEEAVESKGYVKGTEKKYMGNPKLITRSTDPQTVYIRDKIERDDYIDITDFDYILYQYKIMRILLNEALAMSIMIGDGRDDADPDKIEEGHIRPIWLDDELYTIHADVDIEATRKELQGTDTGLYFGDNFVYAEAIVTAALYSREQYKGSGALDFFCTPHLLNVMLLARDRNGHRMYSNKNDLAAALNVTGIYTAEQFENKTRTVGTGADAKTKKLLGMFVNVNDYNVGATKGGEITKFQQFDIDFNAEKLLLETRVSGALTRIKSAIVLEEDVTPEPPAAG